MAAAHKPLDVANCIQKDVFVDYDLWWSKLDEEDIWNEIWFINREQFAHAVAFVIAMAFYIFKAEGSSIIFASMATIIACTYPLGLLLGYACLRLWASAQQKAENLDNRIIEYKIQHLRYRPCRPPLPPRKIVGPITKIRFA